MNANRRAPKLEKRHMRLPASTDELRALRHDLCTPINPILGYCELIAEEAGPPHCRSPRGTYSASASPPAAGSSASRSCWRKTAGERSRAQFAFPVPGHPLASRRAGTHFHHRPRL
jgi:hypothetical protein